MADLRTLIADAFAGIAHNQDDGTYVAGRVLELLRENGLAVVRRDDLGLALARVVNERQIPDTLSRLRAEI